MSNYVAVAQWIKCLCGELKDPRLIPGLLLHFFKEEMNQMVKKNNNIKKIHRLQPKTAIVVYATTQVIPWSLAVGRKQKYT